MIKKSLITPIGLPQQVSAAVAVRRTIPRRLWPASVLVESQFQARRALSRVLIRPEPGHYVLRVMRHGPLLPTVIYQRCPMVVPQPGTVGGPHPDEWCRPLDRSPVFSAQINGRPVPVDRVWTARSLRPVSAAEYAFRIGPLRHWARSHRSMPETRPHRRVDLATLPPLY